MSVMRAGVLPFDTPFINTSAPGGSEMISTAMRAPPDWGTGTTPGGCGGRAVASETGSGGRVGLGAGVRVAVGTTRARSVGVLVGGARVTVGAGTEVAVGSTTGASIATWVGVGEGSRRAVAVG